ncbi:MAG TPA: hypothetical protein VHW72_19525, partial [Candidatus Angelobacter sp.]|nr:hypothetical protein [Candidatus Angelobacter sp.]
RHFKNWSDGALVSSAEINPKEAGRKIYELRKSQNRRAPFVPSLGLSQNQVYSALVGSRHCYPIKPTDADSAGLPCGTAD